MWCKPALLALWIITCVRIKFAWTKKFIFLLKLIQIHSFGTRISSSIWITSNLFFFLSLASIRSLICCFFFIAMDSFYSIVAISTRFSFYFQYFILSEASNAECQKKEVKNQNAHFSNEESNQRNRTESISFCLNKKKIKWNCTK